MLGTLPAGPAKGLGMGPDLLTRWRKEFYEALNWDPDTGVPRPEALKKVGLADYQVRGK